MSLASTNRDFRITVQGRTLELLGSQLYKRRDVALAELVANCWDAGATRVDIAVPTPDEYDRESSSIVVIDNGIGMDGDAVEENYLVIGRNRRAAGQQAPHSRPVMGRKGVGKLAGLGLARSMAVTSWRDSVSCSFTLDAEVLKMDPEAASQMVVPGIIRPNDSSDTPSGTRVTMSNLKHKTPIPVEDLSRALARRFSSTARGLMEIYLNGDLVVDPEIDFEYRIPESGVIEEELGSGQRFKWWAGFSRTVLPKELQGFTVLVNGKTAQAPPYFFDVESTASGQHGTKYLTGAVEADFLDDGTDDESDLVSTDRQEIDWNDDRASQLHEWGDKTTRQLLRDRVQRRGESVKKKVVSSALFAERISRLDRSSAAQVERFLEMIGAAGTEDERIDPLADTILRAFEYRQFHDFVAELDAVAADPEKLQQAIVYMHEWKLLESRAVLEVVRGRLDIIDKFYDLIVEDAPETAPKTGRENLHDLIADYPWLINPEWQVFSEEQRVTSKLRDWGIADQGEDFAGRYDFLALAGDGELVVIEIKRAGHTVTTQDIYHLEDYAKRLGDAQKVGYMAFISTEKFDISDGLRKAWDERDDGALLSWREIQTRARVYYEHYRAILEGDIEDAYFRKKETEVARTREVLDTGAYRGVARRREGLGPQDVNYGGLAEGV